ncbi:hypothetical protein MTO96_008951 [Rhipicephalus appendiculatus]
MPFRPWLTLRFVDGLGSLRGAAYLPELDECTELKCRGTSASHHCYSALLQLKHARLQQFSKQPGRIVDVRVAEEMTMAEPHVGHSDDNDAEMYARNSESCANVQLDPPTVEQDMWKDLRGVPSRSRGDSLRNRVHNEVSHGSYHGVRCSASGRRRGRVASPPSATTTAGSTAAATRAVQKGTLVGTPAGPCPHRASRQSSPWASALEPFTVDASGTKSSTERLQGLAQGDANFDLAAGAHLARRSPAQSSGLILVLAQL